jgi:hypothetical protein
VANSCGYRAFLVGAALFLWFELLNRLASCALGVFHLAPTVAPLAEVAAIE